MRCHYRHCRPWTVILAILVFAGAAAAIPPEGPANTRETRLPGDLEGITVTEHLGESVPADLTFINSAGETVRLGDYFNQGRPVVLNLGYYECPMLCGLVLNGLLESMEQLRWTPGDEYEVVTATIDPREGTDLARAKRENFLAKLDRPGAEAGWHFLTGEQDQIEQLAESVGFGYRWVEEENQYVHAAVIVVLTPDGTVSRYLYGVKYAPTTLRLSLVEAAEGKVGSAMDQLLLFCFHFDSEAGKYSLAAMNLMRLAGGVTVIVIGAGIGVALVREARRRKAEAPGGAQPVSQG